MTDSTAPEGTSTTEAPPVEPTLADLHITEHRVDPVPVDEVTAEQHAEPDEVAVPIDLGPVPDLDEPDVDVPPETWETREEIRTSRTSEPEGDHEPAPTSDNGHADEAEPAPVPLEPDALACDRCGVPVPYLGPDSVAMRAHYRQTSPSGRDLGAIVVSFGQCQTCATTTASAAAIAAAHPGLASRYGSVFVDLLAGVFTAHHVLGLASTSTPTVDTPAADLVRLIDTHGRLGNHATLWRDHLAARPDLRTSSNPHGAPFAHLDHEHRPDGTGGPTAALSALRAAAAADLAVKLSANRPPVLVAPPPVPLPALVAPDGASSLVEISTGCAWCGVAAVPTPAALVLPHVGGYEGAQTRVWRLLRRPTTSGVPAAVDGPANPRWAGHLCQTCTDALESEGAVGVSAAENALFYALGYSPRQWRPFELRSSPYLFTGLVTFAALVTHAIARTAPLPAANPPEAPWLHVRNLSEIRANLVDEYGLPDGTDTTRPATAATSAALTSKRGR